MRYTVPAQNTGPEAENFFIHVIGITTKVSRGTIEILGDLHLIKPKDKGGAIEDTVC